MRVEQYPQSEHQEQQAGHDVQQPRGKPLMQPRPESNRQPAGQITRLGKHKR